jgi:signal transduction histidine kinase
VSSALRAWAADPPPWLIDLGLLVLVGLPTIGNAVGSGVSQDRTLAGIAFGVGATLTILLRRRHPFAGVAVAVALAATAPVSVPFLLPLVVLLYSIGSTRSWEATLATWSAVVVAGLLYLLAGLPDFTTGALVGTAILAGVASALGLYLGGKRDDVDRLRERAELLDREHELLTARAVAEERVRIAQELHDVVAHNVSLIVVQAQALGATVDDDRVAAATRGIADLGREAMAEMHRTLKLLRGRGEAAQLDPQPGLGDLGDLLERSRAAGLDIDLAVEGRPRALAQSVDLSAFRIVQEALTNVVKHAGPARTTVRLAYGTDALELSVVDDGEQAVHGGAAAAPGGHGLIGMRERTALFGGSLAAGPRDERGFEVRASLPYGGGAA